MRIPDGQLGFDLLFEPPKQVQPLEPPPAPEPEPEPPPAPEPEPEPAPEPPPPSDRPIPSFNTLGEREHVIVDAVGELGLRDYQTDSLCRSIRLYHRGIDRLLLTMPTGAGKTVVFVGLIRLIRRGILGRPLRTLVVVHRRELLRQAVKHLSRHGLRVGIIAAGYPHDPDADLWVCSVQTIIGRPDLMAGYDFMVLDECHHCISVTWRKLIADNPSAKLFGVTATPTRLDGHGLGEKVGGVFQELLVGAYPDNLIRDGWLAPTRCFVGARINVEGLRTKMGDWSDRDVAARAMSARLIGDQVEEYRSYAEGLTCLVFGATIDHASMMAEAFARAGYRAAMVSGQTPRPERDRLIGGLETGEVQILASCDLISEGLDVPSVGAVSLCRPTQSLALYLQQIGRGMRPKPDGKALIVLDHAGNVERHGPPDQRRVWDINQLPPDAGPSRDYDEEPGPGGERETLTNAPGKLVEYGKPGALRRFSEDEIRLMPYGKLLRRAGSLEDLQWAAKIRGYKRGWATHAWRERSGLG